MLTAVIIIVFNFGLQAAGMSVDEWIEQMDNEFSLILITDFMDESLVLLKQLMCWETKDIIYLG